MVSPTVISTFAGGGGSSLGYQWAGFRELLAIDFDKDAVETLKVNFKDTPIWQRDIKEVSGKEILEFCKIKKGELDILDGSPPCQGFSTCGKRKVRDKRNDLFKEFARLIDELQPKIFVMENVSGMMKGKMRGRFNEIFQTLKLLNYNVKVKLMNSMWYGVPQSRERLIFIGIRKDLKMEPVYPQPLNSYITTREALNGCKPLTFVKQTEYSKTLCLKIKPGKNGIQKNGKQTHFNYFKIHPDKPCPTVLKSVYYCGLGIYHYSENRELSIEELKRLSSFPDSFILTGKPAEQVARIGNAVMPKFMFYIADCLKRNVLDIQN